MAGFVLVGGRSARMGRDKARLALPSHLLIEDVAAKVSSVADNLALVGESHRYRDLGFECMDDLRPAMGPLAGIETALASERGDLSIVVACDMPGLQSEWLRHLLVHAQESDGSCFICRDILGQIHPLCGLWRNECLRTVRKSLDARRLRLLDLVRELKAKIIPIDQQIRNVNTPGEWADWLDDPANNVQSPTRKVAASC